MGNGNPHSIRLTRIPQLLRPSANPNRSIFDVTAAWNSQEFVMFVAQLLRGTNPLAAQVVNGMVPDKMHIKGINKVILVWFTSKKNADHSHGVLVISPPDPNSTNPEEWNHIFVQHLQHKDSGLKPLVIAALAYFEQPELLIKFNKEQAAPSQSKVTI